MSVIVVLIVAAGAVSAAAVFFLYQIYMHIYKKRIARRMAENNFGEPFVQKPMLSPLRFVLTAAAAVFLLYLILAVAGAYLYSARTSTVSSESSAQKQAFCFEPIDDSQLPQSLLGGVEPGQDISGYTLKKQSDGDITFYCYVNDNLYGSSFPQLLIYSEYTGSSDYYTKGDSMVYENGSTGYSTSGLYDHDESVRWYAINAGSFEGELTLTVEFYTKPSADKALKAMNDETYSEASRYADASSQLRLDLSQLAETAYAE